MKSHTEKAIQLAVYSGFLYHGDKIWYDDERNQWFVSDGDGGYDVPSLSEFFMSPLFWSSLGKALEWGDVDKMHSLGGSPHQESCWCEVITWKANWHRFIDHLVEGKTVEEALALTLNLETEKIALKE